MAKFTINIQEGVIIPSTIRQDFDLDTSCETTKTIIVEVAEGQDKYVTISKSGVGASWIGPIGFINQDTTYELKIEGDNIKNTQFSGTIIFTVRDNINGNIENQVIFTRQHSNTFCSGGPT